MKNAMKLLRNCLASLLVLLILWREVQGKIDRDNESYQRRVIDGAYGAYKRDLERKGDSPMPKDLWMAQIWIPSQKSTEVSGSMQKYTSGYMMSKNQQEQEQGTTTGTISGTGAGKGKGTGGRGRVFQKTEGFSEKPKKAKEKEKEKEKETVFRGKRLRIISCRNTRRP